jgi:hypothetical protein
MVCAYRRFFASLGSGAPAAARARRRILRNVLLILAIILPAREPVRRDQRPAPRQSRAAIRTQDYGLLQGRG